MADSDEMDPVARIRLHLNEATSTAARGDYLEVNQLIDHLKGRLRDASDPESEWYASPWLHAQYRHTLALALYRLFKDKEAYDEIVRAQDLAGYAATGGVDCANLNARLESAKSTMEARLAGAPAVQEIFASTPHQGEDAQTGETRRASQDPSDPNSGTSLY